MAFDGSNFVNAQTRTQYEAQNAKLRGEFFSTTFQVASAGVDITAQLQGPPDSGKPFVIKTDLTKGGGDTINFGIGDELGQAGRRGDEIAVSYEETPSENSFKVTIDTMRVVLGWNELNRWAQANGVSKPAAFATLTGKRTGIIEQEDMLMKMRQRSSTLNTVRPSGRATIDDIRYGDELDTDTFGVAYNILTSNGATPASIGTMKGGMQLFRFVSLGSNFGMSGIMRDPTFTNALLHADVDGDSNPLWTGDLPDWNGCVMKRWNVINHSNPGPIGSSIIPEALLGDTIDGTTIASAITIYAGGRTQATLGAANVIYRPFEYFYGNDKLFGKTISYGTNTAVWYALIIDPADLKWTMFSYTGSAAFGDHGHDITVTARLHTSTTGTGVQTLGNVTYDGNVNKTGTFPTGSRIVQCNAYGVPLCDIYFFGSNAGAKCYGMDRNKQISNDTDFGARKAIGTQTNFGCEMVIDTLGNYHRGFARVQAAYRHPLGGKLATL